MNPGDALEQRVQIMTGKTAPLQVINWILSAKNKQEEQRRASSGTTQCKT